MKLNWIAALLLLGACNSADDQSASQEAQVATHQVFLVRHAEKQSGENPSLTEAGAQRAETLAGLLSEAGITHIHSTDYKRTLETAAPLAAQTGIEITLYDPRDLEAFANELRAAHGVHLVVGHSNTTPQLAEALGGTPGSDIDEASEYDRLYVVSLSASGVSSEIQRYGVRYEASELTDVTE
ncbi:MAG: phosphoglycerate mutase family protein [Pseudomonadota bacterium]